MICHIRVAPKHDLSCECGPYKSKKEARKNLRRCGWHWRKEPRYWEAVDTSGYTMIAWVCESSCESGKQLPRN